ncbi:MAG TPA: hypothetical protein V6C57_25695 [Coleofasciculaceae cyanobacterium]
MGTSRIINRQLEQWAKRGIYCGTSAVVLILLSQVAQAASPSPVGSAAQQGLSADTILAIAIGIIISILYLRGMYLVLHYASETYDIGFDINTDVQYKRETAGKALIVGSLLLVVVSALIISAYGWAALFLYSGPVLCLLGPIVVIVSMEIDVHKYRRALKQRAVEQRSLTGALDNPSSKDDQLLIP